MWKAVKSLWLGRLLSLYNVSVAVRKVSVDLGAFLHYSTACGSSSVCSTLFGASVSEHVRWTLELNIKQFCFRVGKQEKGAISDCKMGYKSRCSKMLVLVVTQVITCASRWIAQNNSSFEQNKKLSIQLASFWAISREKPMTRLLWSTNALLLVRQIGRETWAFLD